MEYTTMAELMDVYNTLAEAQKWTEAYETLKFGVESGYLPAKLLLARLYKDCLFLGIYQEERYKRAEALYKEILNLDLSDKRTGLLCLELADLYGRMQRVVGMMGMLLRARRVGISVSQRDIDYAQHMLSNLDINEFARSTKDALLLATELSIAGSGERLTELLLREASDSGSGEAALMLADFYNDRRNESNIYASEAKRYYRMAAENGYPEYLSR